MCKCVLTLGLCLVWVCVWYLSVMCARVCRTGQADIQPAGHDLACSDPLPVIYYAHPVICSQVRACLGEPKYGLGSKHICRLLGAGAPQLLPE